MEVLVAVASSLLGGHRGQLVGQHEETAAEGVKPDAGEGAGLADVMAFS